jgi:hypothetical protein
VDDLVWYVAYGSNLSRERFLRYLGEPPLADRPLTIGHALWFGGESVVWTGGRAYVDHESQPGRRTLARAWLLSRAQWDELHRQENGPEGDRYPVLLDLGEHDGTPMRSFTGPHRLHPTLCTRPAPDYLRTIAIGLAEAHGIDVRGAVTYLLGCPGLEDCWTEAELLDALSSP